MSRGCREILVARQGVYARFRLRDGQFVAHGIILGVVGVISEVVRVLGDVESLVGEIEIDKLKWNGEGATALVVVGAKALEAGYHAVGLVA